ncbi:MAG TPA: hypothetical protein VJ376_06450, partial [Pseudomonadota bacterium]|nr:hypothetical protein [Pseudomonadota bacterium]
MRPFTVLIGIASGSGASITSSPGGVLAGIGMLADKHLVPRCKLPRRPERLLAFVIMTAASAGGFLVRAVGHIEPGASRALPAGLLAALLAACAAHKPPPPSTEIDETGYRDAVRVLASDEFAGRKPGTPGEDKTVAYLSGQFRRLNLKPGNGESYVQQVPLVEILASADASLSVAGRGGAHPLRYGKDMVIWTERAVPASQLEHSGLIFVGYGIVAPDHSWNDYAGVDVRGKTVLVLDGDPGAAS